MYKDDQISLNFLTKYDKLVVLLKEKVASSSKLQGLYSLLSYFNDNYETFNEEEKKIIKNIIMIGKGISKSANTYYKLFAEQKNDCLNLIKSLEEKQKGSIVK